MPEEEVSAVSPKLGIWIAVAVAICHLGLALWFASITPYRTGGVLLSYRDPKDRSQPLHVNDIGAPDERQHANYVAALLSGQGFPVLKKGDGEGYEDHQPPLYYVLEAGWLKLLGVSSVEASGDGVKIRSLNCVIGAGEVIAVFLLGWWGFRRPEIGIAAALFVALLPMNVALSGAVSNDPLLIFLCSLTLAFCAKALQGGWNVKLALAVGVLVGLSILTKTTALALLPAVLVAVIMAGEGRPKPAAWAAAILPMILIPLPWLIRNQSLYGDPFAISAFNDAFVNSPQASAFIQGRGMVAYLTDMVLAYTSRSFFGVFGYMDIWLNEKHLPNFSTPNVLYRLLFAVSFVAFLGWIGSWKKVQYGKTNAVQIMNLTFFVVTGLLFLRFNLQYFQGQGRYLFPAIGP
ncbi:MAG TPA: glycosyltransferase family 39 protein, partial [Fimbriimonas sp.]|nr:glycosyltransferase family 39 protein [Fimbriimonas sp.]